MGKGVLRAAAHVADRGKLAERHTAFRPAAPEVCAFETTRSSDPPQNTYIVEISDVKVRRPNIEACVALSRPCGYQLLVNGSVALPPAAADHQSCNAPVIFAFYS